MGVEAPGAEARHAEAGGAEVESLAKDERGAAYAEFLIAFPLVLILFLCLVQLSLMYVGKLAVRHAANRAARAAVVVLPDHPRYYDGEAINQIDYDGSGSDSGAEGGFAGMGAIPGGSVVAGSGSSRLRAIRSAAYIPLTPLSPSLDAVLGEQSVASAFDRGAADIAAGALTYNRGAVSVTFPSEPAGMEFRESFEPREQVTTRVTYLYHCGVPIVNRFMCHSFLGLMSGAPDVLLEGLAGRMTEEERELVERGFDIYRDYFRGRDDLRNGVEELQFSEAPWLVAPFAFGENRFAILRAEAVLPNQGAGYTYAD